MNTQAKLLTEVYHEKGTIPANSILNWNEDMKRYELKNEEGNVIFSANQAAIEYSKNNPSAPQFELLN